MVVITREGSPVSEEVTKGPKKNLSTPLTLYKNDAGTSFALSYLVSMIASKLGHAFGEFTIGEDENGRLVVHTGMVRDSRMEELVGNAKNEHSRRECKQPCRGECEDSCHANVGGL